MARQTLKPAVLLGCLLLAAQASAQQPRNLLQNPNADAEAQHWRATGQATVEACAGGGPCFVVRNGGSFYQDVILPEDAAGRYAVLNGRGSSERINPDGAITGLPALYGYMFEQKGPNGGRVLDYLQGQNLLGSARNADEWVNMWGVFRVPEGTKMIRFFLNQAERGGVPHNGSAARFDDVGLYLFSTKEEAQAFVGRQR